MLRISRQRSSTGTYHIILRGANRQEIFHDDDVKNRFTDEDAREEIIKAIASYEIAKIKSLPKSQRGEIVSKVKKIEGLTQRQISRIPGVSLSPINRA